MAEHRPYGLMAEFDDAGALLNAAREVRSAGHPAADAFSPFPVPGLAEVLDFRERRIPVIALVCGLAGAILAFLLQWYSAVIDYPYVVGGKPLASWPAFLVTTFVAGILAAVVATLVSLFVLNRLPQPYHPVFNDPGFGHVSKDRFFLLFTGLPEEDRQTLTKLLGQEGATGIREVAP